MKVIMRIAVGLMVFSYLFLELFTTFFLKYKYIGAVFVAVGALSGLFLFIYLFYWWAKTKFIKKWVKFAWLLVLLFLYYMIGPIVFYFAVFEMRKTVLLPRK